MAASSMKQLGTAFKKLNDESIKKVFLTGDPGVGKTWMARMLGDRAFKEHKFDIVLWVFLNREYVDPKRTIYESIARQLSLIPASNESEVEDDSKPPKANEEKELEEKIDAKLEEMRVLFILDDQVNHKDSEKDFDLTSKVESLLPTSKPKSWKILITTKTINNDDPNRQESIIEVEPLSVEESLSLLYEKAGQVPDEAMAKFFIKKSRPLPADIIVLAKALNHFRESKSGVQKLEIAKEEVLLHDDHTYNAMQLLLDGCELLPSSVLLDWYRPGNQFLQHGQTLHYKDLIAYWMLEGYLGHFDCIKSAYEKGHSVLMELLDCGLLKEQNDGYVMVNGTDLILDPSGLCEFIGTIHLGLANVLNGDFGRIVETNGMMKILCIGEEKKKASALLVDANHLSREIPEDLHQSMKDVEVLAIFNPTDESLPLPLFEMHNCRLLVLRNCDFLNSINEALRTQNQPDHNVSVSDADRTHEPSNMTQAPDANTNATPKVEALPSSLMSDPKSALQKLTVLEISGPCCLEEIPDDLFKRMPNLQSLNLSLLQIGSLPSSFYGLSKLVWLILRGCYNLKELRSLKKLEKLQVIDLSGASSFSRFCDRSFSSNKELQTLNLSQSQIKKLPLLRDLGKLNHLLLRDCTQISRLPKISALTSLQILDLPGATNFKEFHDPSIEKLTDLKVINISRTAVKKLPLHMSNPRHLCLSGCTRLTRLSFIESMKDLEILDLSGCSNLKEINENFFHQLARLRVFDLSDTQVKTLPSLSNVCNLRQLLLARCASLEKLGELNSLEKLEVLDLSGSTALKELQSFEEVKNLKKLDLSATQITCLPRLSNSSNLCELFLKNCTKLKELPSSGVLSKLEELNLSGASALDEIQVDFFKDMTNLHILDLSETNIRKLPSLSDLKNLYHLSLRNCQNLTEVPDLEELLKLEVLDLSGTDLKKLPEFKESSHLRCLLLKDCSKLENFNQVEILGLLKDPDKELPCKISRLTEFKVLALPKANNATADLQETKCPADEPKEYPWSISWPAQSPVAKFSISMNCIQFLQLLEENLSLRTSLSHFHFYVHPVEGETGFGDKFSNYELFLREIYIQTRQLSGKKEKQGSSQTQGNKKVNNQTGQATEEEKQGSLDISGFDGFPKGLELVLAHAKNVFLISNPFLRCLIDLGADNIKEMKVCWIERCSNLETVLPVDEVENTATTGDDIRGESEVGKSEEHSADITESKIIHRGSLQSNSFGNLKCLYLEHCPRLSYICHSSRQMGNLVVLQIKYCPKLKTLFGDESADLPKLQKLQLWELPNLQEIVCNMSSLSTLNVGECPQLLHILSSTHLPEDLEVLEIRSCDKLTSIFEGSILKLLKLRKLHLWDLPKLQDIGADLPQLHPTIRGCPALQDWPAAS